MSIEQATFTLDSLPGQEFTGFTTGETWNGWAVPAFEFDEAKRILDALLNPGYFNYYYSIDLDAFYIYTPDGTDKYEGSITKVSSQDILLYPIGAFAWTWEKGV